MTDTDVLELMQPDTFFKLNPLLQLGLVLKRAMIETQTTLTRKEPATGKMLEGLPPLTAEQKERNHLIGKEILTKYKVKKDTRSPLI